MRALPLQHLGGMAQHAPSFFGFDEYFGCPHGLGACPLASCFCPDEGCSIGGAPTWTGCPIYANDSIITQPLDLLSISARYVAAATDFVERASAAGDPFFLYFASHHVHSPQFAGGDTTNTTARGRFGDSLRELDASVGHLTAVVDRLGLASAVLTIFTSDNGPSLRNEVRGGNAGLLRCGKGTTFEGGSRVPMIVHWPSVTPPNTIARTVMTSLDLLPTLVSIVGGTVPKEWVLDGFEATEVLLTGVGGSPRDGAVVYFPQFAQRSRGINGSGIYAARAGRWKAHWCLQGTLQSGVNNSDVVCRPSLGYTELNVPLVYDIELDPSERYALDPLSQDYSDGLAATTAVANAHAARMGWWPEPLLNAGDWDRYLQPCCNPGCTPFPSCCRCDKGGPDPPPADPCTSPATPDWPLH